MKQLAFTPAVLAAFGIIAACSQGDTHPPMLGDCDSCSKGIVATGGDAAADTSKPDVQANDSSTNDSSTNDSSTSDASGNDAGSDAASDGDAGSDGALLDTGTGD